MSFRSCYSAPYQPGFFCLQLTTNSIRELERLFEHSKSVFVCFLLCAYLVLELFLCSNPKPPEFIHHTALSDLFSKFHTGLRIMHNTQFCLLIYPSSNPSWKNFRVLSHLTLLRSALVSDSACLTLSTFDGLASIKNISKFYHLNFPVYPSLSS